MKKYSVQVAKLAWIEVDVEVLADSVEEAKDKALAGEYEDWISHELLDTDMNPEMYPPEVLNVEEIE